MTKEEYKKKWGITTQHGQVGGTKVKYDPVEQKLYTWDSNYSFEDAPTYYVRPRKPEEVLIQYPYTQAPVLNSRPRESYSGKALPSALEEAIRYRSGDYSVDVDRNMDEQPTNKPNKPGETVAAMWTRITGTPWSTAKKLGLTDGSYARNINILRGLKSGEITKESVEFLQNPEKHMDYSMTFNDDDFYEEASPAPDINRPEMQIPRKQYLTLDDLSFEDYNPSLVNDVDYFSDRDFRRTDRYLAREDRRNARRARRDARRATPSNQYYSPEDDEVAPNDYDIYAGLQGGRYTLGW